MNQKQIELEKKLQKFNKVMLKILRVLLAIIVVLLIALLIQRYFTKQKYKREKLSLDEYILTTTKFELGETNEKKERVIKYEIEDDFKKVYLNADANLTDNMVIDSCILSTKKIMKTLTQDEEFLNMDQKGISFNWAIDVVDGYGNISKVVGCRIDFLRKDFLKYKWENITIDGIKETAHTFWVNPVLEK